MDGLNFLAPFDDFELALGLHMARYSGTVMILGVPRSELGVIED